MKTNRVLAVVLGGGQGTRLLPLTAYRSKPAVPLAGKYRLIDVPLSNCINSGVQRIYVLTQFLSVSLHRHIRRTYRFDHFSGGFVEILAAQQTMEEGTDWYQGTADAVRKNLKYFNHADCDHVLVLSGDQLYRMDFALMLETHRATNADVTIAAKPVRADEVSALGIMRLGDNGQVAGFLEKPQRVDELDGFRLEPSWIDAWGIESQGREFIANMGIYLFRRQTLFDVLEKTPYRDFGKEVFPASIRTRNVQVHLFDGYWEDIGTIGAFYQANLDLARSRPQFELASAHAPIYSRPRFLPPTRLVNAEVRESLLADGCLIGQGVQIDNSVVGLRCMLGDNVRIRQSVLMGADEYESPDELDAAMRQGLPRIGIGEGSVIDGAIVDKNCRIGRGVRVSGVGQSGDRDVTPECVVRDGVVVVKKGAVLPDGWSLGSS
jgi:glucose-1-phosphate adenylyltransferase